MVLDPPGARGGAGVVVNVLVAGARGLIGQALVAHLLEAGHQVSALVRPGGGPGGGAGKGSGGRSGEGPGVAWDPAAGRIDQAALAGGGFDAVVNLAGAGIGDRRWSPARRKELVESRVGATRLLVGALGAPGAPRVLVNASAVGYYGDRGSQVLTEASGPGQGFLAELCQAWEKEALAAASQGVRVVVVRTGIVLAPKGGALGRQLPLFRLGLGARLGRGQQYTSWISLHDEVAVLTRCLEDPGLAGAVNATAPHPVTNAELTAAIARQLGRPAFLSVPPGLLRLALGRELADEMLLASQRVLPARLEEAGFSFSHPTLAGALRAVLGRDPRPPGQ